MDKILIVIALFGLLLVSGCINQVYYCCKEKPETEVTMYDTNNLNVCNVKHILKASTTKDLFDAKCRDIMQESRLLK